MFWFADLLEKFFGSFSTTDIVPPPPVTSRFERALEFYLENEGGNVDHKSDPGGKTSRGISAFYNPELGDPSLLSDDEVKAFYKVKYWSSLFERLDNDLVAIKVFDIATNAGFDDGSTVLQGAINMCGGDVVVDGVMGSKTIAAANGLHAPLLLQHICDLQFKMYEEKIVQTPSKSVFRTGWTIRSLRVPT